MELWPYPDVKNSSRVATIIICSNLDQSDSKEEAMHGAKRFWPFTLSIMFLLCLLIVVSGPAAAGDEEDEVEVPTMTEAERDSLMILAESHFGAEEYFEAEEIFARLVEAYPKDAVIRTWLGTVQLKRENFGEAEKSFEKAKKLDKKYAPAYVGLGMTHAQKPARGITAFYNYRRAIGHAKRAARIDSSYGPAYRLLGEVYEKYQEDHKKAIRYYLRYIELEPDNPDGLYHFGLASVLDQQYENIDKYIAPHLRANPDDFRLLPLAAQGYFYQDKPDLALEYFERYLQNKEGHERRLYTDISLIGSQSELEDYKEIQDEGVRIAYLEQFWARRDPDILTKINERIIEHYRRVWFARTYFADRIYPWDKRGEVYIRYGEPDFRSRSAKREFRQSPEVEAVRNRMAVQIYGPEAQFLTFVGPVYPIRSHRHSVMQRSLDDFGGQVEDQDLGGDPSGLESVDIDAPAEDGGLEDDAADADFESFGRVKLLFGDYAPVTSEQDIAMVSWEAWTYTQIQGGIEIVFTDEKRNGRFDFAPIPPVSDLSSNMIRSIAVISQHAPATIYANAAGEVPDYYRPGLLGPALNFYYDLANFSSHDGHTSLEIYYGIPPEQVEAIEEADSSYIHVEAAIALADEDHTVIYRTKEEFYYRTVGEMNKTKGSFVPEILKTQIPPGKYELQVQLKDRISGRTGLYKQSLEVPDFTIDVLQLSDIELAMDIGATEQAAKFRKGDVWIIPMPTRSYGDDQKVHAYYEVYNLSKDTFGQTRYKVNYTVRTGKGHSVGVFGAMKRGIGSIFNRGKPQVSVSYEQVGSDPTEREYFELDLSKAKAGLQVLEVRVEDLVSGQSSSREVRFRYGG